jgi:hypothetical protein
MKLFIIMICFFSLSSYAADVIRLDGISIQGSSEEPNVLYVTPWQPAPGTGRLFSPVDSYRKQWLKPMSRQVMRREVKYLNHFQQINKLLPSEYKNK